MLKVAFLGLGAMGSRMAQQLLGHTELTVTNRSRDKANDLVEAGARWAATPRAAAADADVVFSMVSDDVAAAHVWLDPEHGALHSLRPGALAVECSTTTPAWTRRLGEAVRAHGARFLDAPVAGSTPQADAGQLVFVVGGGESDLAEVAPLLQLMGSKLLHAGPDETHGALLKLVINSFLATQAAVMAELLRAVEAQGVNPAHFAALLAQTAVSSPVAAGAASLMLAHDHAPRFTVDLIAKDLRYANTLGELPVTNAALKQFEEAAAVGLGGRNFTAVHLLGEG